jgi:hypothetical protein
VGACPLPDVSGGGGLVGGAVGAAMGGVGLVAGVLLSPPVPWQSSVRCACVTVDAIVPNYLVSVVEELDKPYVILS